MSSAGGVQLQCGHRSLREGCRAAGAMEKVMPTSFRIRPENDGKIMGNHAKDAGWGPQSIAFSWFISG